MVRYLIARMLASLLIIIELIYFILQSNFIEYGGFILENNQPQMVEARYLWIVYLPHIMVLSLSSSLFYWETAKSAKILGVIAGISIELYHIYMSAFLSTVILNIFIIFGISSFGLKKLKLYLKYRTRRRNDARILTDSSNSNKNSNQISPYRSKIKAILLLACFAIPVLPFTNPIKSKENLVDYLQESMNFSERKAYYRNFSLNAQDKDAEVIKAYLGAPVEESKILNRIDKILLEGGGDFAMNYILRIMYLNQKTAVLSGATINAVKTGLLKAKYWFTENNSVPDDIYYTENHQINYHTAELLAAQLYPKDLFIGGNMTAQEHFDHATYMIDRWLTWKGKYGFSEWQSNTYLALDISALLNLVDFAENQTIANRAAILLDLICFDFANQWYKNIYATAHARCYGETKIAPDAQHLPETDDIFPVAWVFLGLGQLDLKSEIDFAATCAATSDRYSPSPVLEKIALDQQNSTETKNSNGFIIQDGLKMGIEYTEENLMFYWGAAAPVTEWTVDVSFATIDKYNLDPGLICGDGIPEILTYGAKLHGITRSEYAHLIREITQGVALERANIYTYRTPYFQLSGAQDYQKGLNGIQEHIWQASLSTNAIVFTSNPGGVGFKGGSFMGGWKPRATFYKNLGIIQYDYNHTILEGKIGTSLMDLGLNFVGGNKPYNHAYFPRWAFDEVYTEGHWTFGSKDGGYIALYSHNPIYWANDYEINSIGQKNCWIVELASIEQFASLTEFMNAIKHAEIIIESNVMGFDITYQSPQLGKTQVSWEGDFTIADSTVDIGPYNRFQNKYASVPYGSDSFIISLGSEILTLNMKDGFRSDMIT